MLRACAAGRRPIDGDLASSFAANNSPQNPLTGIRTNPFAFACRETPTRRKPPGTATSPMIPPNPRTPTDRRGVECVCGGTSVFEIQSLGKQSAERAICPRGRRVNYKPTETIQFFSSGTRTGGEAKQLDVRWAGPTGTLMFVGHLLSSLLRERAAPTGAARIEEVEAAGAT